jgi:2-aminomuconate deaminase
MTTASQTDLTKTRAGKGRAQLSRNGASREAFPSLRRAGPFVFFSGTGPHKPNAAPAGAAVGRRGVIAADIRKQAKDCIENVRDILCAVGGGLEHLVELTTYLVDMRDFARYNEIYNQYFSHQGPARTTVAVNQLARPDTLIEMKGVAYIAEDKIAHKQNGAEKWSRVKS